MLIGLVILLFQSCEEYFEQEPVSLFTRDNIFTNVEYAEQALLGVYQLMTNDEGYSKRVSMYYGVDTDIAMCSGSIDNGRRGIARYAANSGNDEIRKPWVNFYKGIERANVCINGITESEVYNNGTEEQQEKMRKLHGEALTLRALFYYELIRNWGDVPFKTESSKTGDDFNYPKTNRDTIYRHIIDDLYQAEKLVPWRSGVENTAEKFERVTKGAVKGLMARIALARGGFSLRKGREMRRGPNHLKYYEIARDQCKDIMESGEHGLNPSFEEVFKKMCRYEYDTEYGEVMWEVGFGKYDSGEVGYYIGNPSANESTYGRATGGMLAIPTFWLSFDTLDTRRDITISLYEIDDEDRKQLLDFADIRIAKWRRMWLEPLMPGTDKYTGVNWPLLRYADVLLMFAEAENELNQGPTQEAKDALRQVRERAFAGNEDQIGTLPNDYQGFFDAIVQERAWELAGECLRKHDLIRWNLLDDKLKEMKQELESVFNQEGTYTNIAPQLIWRNDGTEMEIMNWNQPMDSAAVANRDSLSWPFVAEWGNSLNEDYRTLIAQFFEPNRKELLPIHISIVEENKNLENDYGY